MSPTIKDKASAPSAVSPNGSTEATDGAELLDDPVRMYLRKIGRVTLLTAADERRLA
jgi:hypothetical protein